jgi:hypothetical protein
MMNTRKQAILKQHSIETRTAGGRILAADVYTTPDLAVHTEWADVTDWDSAKLYAWLGY